MTANPPRYKLQHALGEAVALILLAISGRRLEKSPLCEFKLSVHFGLGLEINTLSLTQPGDIHTRPELASLVQEDLVAVGEVLLTATIVVS